MLKHFKREVALHFKQNTVLYMVVLFILITGIMTGSFTVTQLSSGQKINVGNYLQEFFSSRQTLSVDRSAIFSQGIWQHFLSVFFIWLLGLFFWGLPFVLVIIGIRGFLLGFTVGFMVEYYGFGGFLFSLICILPQGLLYVPSYFAMGIFTSTFCIEGFKNRRIRYTGEEIRRKLALHTVRIFILFLLLLVGILVETFITPLFFPLFAWIF